ncbi:MAG: redoxin domain-containing protein [Candidatus Eisenbacteria bacterium]
MLRRLTLSSSQSLALSLSAASLFALGLGSLDAQADGTQSKAGLKDKAAHATMEVRDATKAMADHVSGTAEVGEQAPEFVLTDTDGHAHKLSDYKGKVVVLEWFNPDCPFVKKHHLNNKSMAEAYKSVQGDDVVWLAINSGAAGKQGAGLDRNREARKEYGIAYPVLLDATGIVGHAYGAKNTPHMFVIDKAGKLAYVGAIDDNASPDVLGEVNYVVQTVGHLRKGESVTMNQTKPYGCSVKYAS